MRYKTEAEFLKNLKKTNEDLYEKYTKISNRIKTMGYWYKWYNNHGLKIPDNEKDVEFIFDNMIWYNGGTNNFNSFVIDLFYSKILPFSDFNDRDIDNFLTIASEDIESIKTDKVKKLASYFKSKAIEHPIDIDELKNESKGHDYIEELYSDVLDIIDNEVQLRHITKVNPNTNGKLTLSPEKFGTNEFTKGSAQLYAGVDITYYFIKTKRESGWRSFEPAKGVSFGSNVFETSYDTKGIYPLDEDPLDIAFIRSSNNLYFKALYPYHSVEGIKVEIIKELGYKGALIENVPQKNVQVIMFIPLEATFITDGGIADDVDAFEDRT